jgi:hypothetical protein
MNYLIALGKEMQNFEQHLLRVASIHCVALRHVNCIAVHVPFFTLLCFAACSSPSSFAVQDRH